MNVPVIVVIIVLVIVIILFPCRYAVEGCTQGILRQLAIDTFKAFNEHGVVYWADYGTLLGIVRENDIIRHDTDVDVCFLDFEENHVRLRKAIDSLEEKYFYTYHHWGAYRIRKLIWYVDIYIVKDEDGMYVDPTGKIPKELVGNLTTIRWNGVDVPVPERTHDALKWRYGKNYMTPLRWVEATNGG